MWLQDGRPRGAHLKVVAGRVKNVEEPIGMVKGLGAALQYERSNLRNVGHQKAGYRTYYWMSLAALPL